MTSKIALIFCATALLIGNTVNAQSSHDKVYGVDPDMPDDRSSRFEIIAPDKKFKMGFRGFLQQDNRFSYQVATKQADVSMHLPKARFSVYGSAFDPFLTYVLQLGFEGQENIAKYSGGILASPGSKYLKDYYVNMAAHPEYFHLRIGKFKLPFSRRHMMSSSQIQFNELSEADNYFSITDDGRDVGLMAHNGFNEPLEWAVATVSNGLVARIGANFNFIHGYDMVDWGRSDFGFSIGASGFMKTSYKSVDTSDIRASGDFIVKAGGFSTNGVFYYARKKPDEADAANLFGATLNLGYLFSQLEPVVRGSWIKNEMDNDFEILGGLNYYFFGHHLKTQLYGGAQLSGSKVEGALGGVQIQFAI